MNRNRYRAVMGVLLLLVVAAFMMSVGWGTVSITPARVAAVFLNKVGLGTRVEVPPLQAAVLWNIRLPRVLMALIVGGALAVSGAVLQGVFGNPLAEPSLLGVSGGAVVGAMVGTIVTVSGRASPGLPAQMWPLPLAGFAGALAVSLGLYRFYQRLPKRDGTTFVLIGVIANVILGALITFLPAMFRNGGLGSDTTLWTMGSLGRTLWPAVYVAAPLSTGAVILLWRMAPKLNLMALGDANAEHLGVDSHAVRVRSIVVVSLLTGASVSFAGVIAFVGLVVPHALRLLIGSDHRYLIPAGAVGGALMVALADLLARTLVPPSELPIGVLTILAGGTVVLLAAAAGAGKRKVGLI